MRLILIWTKLFNICTIFTCEAYHIWQNLSSYFFSLINIDMAVAGIESGNRPILRMGDFHVGHLSYTFNPWHVSPFVPIIPSGMSLDTIGDSFNTIQGTLGLLGDGKVFINGKMIVKNGDRTACTDTAGRPSGSVYANGQLVFRTGDPTLGHCKAGTGTTAAAAAKTAFDTATGSTYEATISAAIAAGNIVVDSFGISFGGPVLNPNVFNNG